MVNRLIATGLLAIFFLLLVSCGTGSTGITPREESHSGTGVWAGNYEVIRYNEAGNPDPTLNSTLQLALKQAGPQTLLEISVKDSVHTGDVALDVHYDGGAIHPTNVVFHDALGNDSQVLSASFLNTVPGLAAIGQTGIHGYRAPAINGSFATVTFTPGGQRATSAVNSVHSNEDGVGDLVGDAAGNPIGGDTAEGVGLPNIVVDDDQLAHPGSSTVSWYSAWHLADGNQNGIVEIADLTPLGAHLNESVAEHWNAVPADYNGDGLVTLADLSKMGKHLTEGTQQYLVEVGDNDGGAGALTTVGTFKWGLTEQDGDWTAPTDPQNPTPPVPESLDPIFKKWSLTFDGASTPPVGDLSAIDLAGNADGSVSLHITPQRDAANGVPGVVEIFKVAVPDTTRYITVNNVSVRVIGAAGGGGGGEIFDDANLQGSVVANSTLDIKIEAISGLYSSPGGGGNFNSTDPFPADMTQTDYDETLAIVKDATANGFVSWTIANGGAPGFRYRSDWITFTPAPPEHGDLGQGTVFPDDDPESTGATSEGAISVHLALSTDQDGDPGRSIILQPYDQTFLFDVTADPNAPLLDDPFDLQSGQTATALTLLEGTQITLGLTDPNPIVDPTATTLQLLEIDANGGVTTNPVAFTYTPGAPDQGDFFFRSLAPASIQAYVTGIGIHVSSQYHFTFQDDSGGPWSSLNTPTGLLTTQDPPPPADLLTIPSVISGPSSGFNRITIRQEEPELRRNPARTYDLINNTSDKADENAYNDELKMSGDNFVIGVDQGQVYPRITIIANDPPVQDFGPDLIDASTQTVAGPIVLLDQLNGEQIVVDTLGIQVGDNSELKFAYKVFNQNGTAAGQGTFLYEELRPDDPAPFPVAWGVNVFNRGLTPTETKDDLPSLVGNKTVHASTLTDGQGKPDVMWFQFNGGYVSNTAANYNTRAVFEWWDGNGNDFSDGLANVELRIAGITDNGDYLALHVLDTSDFFPNGGNFVAGNGYIVHLNDQHPDSNGWDCTYGIGNPDGDDQMLFVSN